MAGDALLLPTKLALKIFPTLGDRGAIAVLRSIYPIDKIDDVGSVANSAGRSGKVNFDQEPTGTILRATLRGRNHPTVCPPVLAVFPQLPGFGGNNCGARPLSGPCHYLALGPAFRAHSESTTPPRTPGPNRSWRVDETYVRVAGQWTYLYRAVDSSGDTIDFMLSPKRDLTAAKLFLRLALSGSGGVRPRVVNVDGHPAHGRAIAELKDSHDLGRRCLCRPSPYLNNIIEQDHRFIKKPLPRASDSGRQKEHGGRSKATRQCI
jgi:hypothetical protein